MDGQTDGQRENYMSHRFQRIPLTWETNSIQRLSIHQQIKLITDFRILSFMNHNIDIIILLVLPSLAGARSGVTSSIDLLIVI